MVSEKLSEYIVMTHEWRYIFLFTLHTFNKTMKLKMLADWNDMNQQQVQWEFVWCRGKFWPIPLFRYVIFWPGKNSWLKETE
jgi:hypothetical protein